MKKLILASGSPRRKELLQQLGLKFDVAPSDYAEDMTKKLPSRWTRPAHLRCRVGERLLSRR